MKILISILFLILLSGCDFESAFGIKPLFSWQPRQVEATYLTGEKEIFLAEVIYNQEGTAMIGLNAGCCSGIKPDRCGLRSIRIIE